jgi:MATE family multidrug resistance protein
MSLHISDSDESSGCSSNITRRQIFREAWPVILGQALTPLTGVVDVCMMGRFGSVADLAAVALGATVINFVFWSFGFLRMGVTGMTAQARGAGEYEEVAAILLRAFCLAIPAGFLLLAVSPFVAPFALHLLDTPLDAFAAADGFTQARFFGAPAALGAYAITGWLIGLGRTRWSLFCQIVLNGMNILLDFLFVGIFHTGSVGIGIGTSLAEWSTLGAGLLVVRWISSREKHGFSFRFHRGLFVRHAMIRLISVNADLMVRTLALLFMFSWFTKSGARLGPTVLAGSHLLMQFVNVSAFVLDGFAFTAEHRVGVAAGEGSVSGFLRAMRMTGEFSFAGGLLFSVIIWLSGPFFIDALTHSSEVRVQAEAMLPWCALIPVIGAGSWLLDGVFIGATQGKILRNAAILVALGYLLTDFVLKPWGAEGLWLALLLGYVYRAVALGVCVPGLVKRIAAGKVAG